MENVEQYETERAETGIDPLTLLSPFAGFKNPS